MVQIYTDTETIEMIRQLKEKKGDEVNLSKLFKDMLRSEIDDSFVKKTEVDKLNEKMNELQFKDAQLKDEMERVKNLLLKQRETKKAEIDSIKLEESIQEKKEKEKFESVYNFIIEVYELDSGTANDLAEEWLSIIDNTTFQNISEFLESKGYVQND